MKRKERIKHIGNILENTKSFANNPYYIATKEVFSDIAIKGYYEKETRVG